jgi:hypothetical protein
MATARALQRLQTLIWVLIYGGLLTLVLGIATARTNGGAAGWVLVVAGGLVATVGAALIAVRARSSADDSVR